MLDKSPPKSSQQLYETYDLQDVQCKLNVSEQFTCNYKVF